MAGGEDRHQRVTVGDTRSQGLGPEHSIRRRKSPWICHIPLTAGRQADGPPDCGRCIHGEKVPSPTPPDSETMNLGSNIWPSLTVELHGCLFPFFFSKFCNDQIIPGKTKKVHFRLKNQQTSGCPERVPRAGPAGAQHHVWQTIPPRGPNWL